MTRPNRGFGAGHNVGIGTGNSRFCLVSNVDLTFEKDSLTKVVAMACDDDEDVACWDCVRSPTNIRSSTTQSRGRQIGARTPVFCCGVALSTWSAGLRTKQSSCMVRTSELSYRFRERGLRLSLLPERRSVALRV